MERIAAEINAEDGGRALAVTADAGEKADLVNLVSQARAAFGPIHIIFNNAAAGVVYGKDGKGIWDNDDAVGKTALDVNLMATWRLAELTTDDMQAHGKGSSNSVQSCVGFTPIPPAITYGVNRKSTRLNSSH